MRENFTIYHPLINLLYFLAVLVLSVVVMNPVFLGISLICAFIYGVYLKGATAARFGSVMTLSLIFLSITFNALLNYRGATALFPLPFDLGPVTFESIMYGLTTGLMIGSVIMWFVSFNVIISSDKLTFLFGRLLPSSSLIFIMVLRFIPRYREQIKKISEAQQTIGMGIDKGTLRTKIKNGSRILSIMFTWALENAIQTADSMKSRGYGIRNRTSFRFYKFTLADRILMIVIIVFTFITAAVFALGFIRAEFYPFFEIGINGDLSAEIGRQGSLFVSILGYVSFSALSLIPVWLGLKERIYWSRTKDHNTREAAA